MVAGQRGNGAEQYECKIGSSIVGASQNGVLMSGKSTLAPANGGPAVGRNQLGRLPISLQL